MSDSGGMKKGFKEGDTMANGIGSNRFGHARKVDKRILAVEN